METKLGKRTKNWEKGQKIGKKDEKDKKDEKKY